MAAGALLVSEAGGLVSDLRGDSTYLVSGNIIAGTPKVFGPLLKLIEDKLPASIKG
jgi:myo-inositol-1(or 4)-monophosphatase